MSDTDLSFVTTADLWEELSKRSDAALLVFYKHKNEKQGETFCYYSGGVAHALGLAKYADAKLVYTLREDWNGEP